MLSLSLDAASATGGLVTPAVGGAIARRGLRPRLRRSPPRRRRGRARGGASPSQSLSLRGRMLLRSAARRARPERRRQGHDGRRCARAARLRAGSRAGGDIATTVPLDVGLPGGDSVTSRPAAASRPAASRSAAWLRGGERPASPDRPGDRPAGRTPVARRHRRGRAAASRRTSPRRPRCSSATPGRRGSTRAASRAGSSRTTAQCTQRSLAAVRSRRPQLAA